MSNASIWHPLNVEPIEQHETEVDDTKEIQIEEALKQYQAALKLHSEGPQSYEKTAEAYKELFASDIFKDVSIVTEFAKFQEYGDFLVFDSILDFDVDAGPAPAVGTADSAPNTLAQILHLSYKNYGQFLLESMQYAIDRHGPIDQHKSWRSLQNALDNFAQALDKEDTDLDLWLRAASVASMLGSKRLTRFCLEAVLDGNDEQWEGLLQLPGLEEGFAGNQLSVLVERLEDNVSLMQEPLSSLKSKKLSSKLKERLNPFSFAPLPAEVAVVDHKSISERAPESVTLTPTKWDWASIGDIIVTQYLAEHRGLTPNVLPGSNIVFEVPLDSIAAAPVINEGELSVEEAKSAPERQPRSLEEAPSTTIHVGDEPRGENGDDTVMEEAASNVEPKVEESVSAALTETTEPIEIAAAPSRKRSTDSAGLPETAEGGRSRSKRIRGRESIIEPSSNGTRPVQDTNQNLKDQLEHYTHADQCLYEIVKDLYLRLGVEGMKDPGELRNLLMSLPDQEAVEAMDKVACDMYLTLQSAPTEAMNTAFSSIPFPIDRLTRYVGLNAFLGLSQPSTEQACDKPTLEIQGLDAFVRKINEGWFTIKEVAFDWMEQLLSQGVFCEEHDDKTVPQSSYQLFKWPEDLKRNLVQTIVNFDDYIHERMIERFEALTERMLQSCTHQKRYTLSAFDASQMEIVQTLFELHLDIFSLIRHPHSKVDKDLVILQSDRLERWSAFARDAVQIRADCFTDARVDEFALRHIWASVFQMVGNDDVRPEHVTSAMAGLKSLLQDFEIGAIQLQNNAIMPDLSISAIDRELTRINMKDFFAKVFDYNEKDPVTIIESLEPILELENGPQPTTVPERAVSEDHFVDARSSISEDYTDAVRETPVEQSSPILEMRKFLADGSINVHLSLWQRLTQAYQAIEYEPKVFSCYLRCIETIVANFRSSDYLKLTPESRQNTLMMRIRVVDDLVTGALLIIRDEKSAFECISFEQVQSSMSAIADLLHIFSAANMFRDLIRIKHTPVPSVECLPASCFARASEKLDECQLRLWLLQYHLLKEGIAQESAKFPAPSEDLFEFIRHVHHATGVRHYCHLSNRGFLRLAKDELLRLGPTSDVHSYEVELCQILHDLYGLKFNVEPFECQDFMTQLDFLDKKTALNILSFIMAQAEKMDLKDMLKTELRSTIEKVHTALGRPKQNDDISFNRKVITAHLKAPINPVLLFNCLKGVGSLHTKHISEEEAKAASKGWYYLMGNIALTKFRSQKRQTQGPTEDLNYAQAFFVQDLEHSVERWETWYRLAQTNDTQLEEAISWNADKMNSSSVELLNYQRTAINCYVMAVACAVRDADATPQTLAKISKMYTEFGNRIYSSAREPFDMEAFQIRESEKRFCNNQHQMGTYRGNAFNPLHPYTAWKFAGALFKRAIKGRPNEWWNYYMLAKCRWKMWSFEDDQIRLSLSHGAAPPPRRGPQWEEVIDAVTSAIETLPCKKGRSGDPILEPHYKLVSIINKLVRRNAMTQEEGVKTMSSTSYSQNIKAPETADDWDEYILAVLKALRTADKSSWHHRITVRAAHIIFARAQDKVGAAEKAKHELMQQMFTKTMMMQVWKPENERPGRHFVYMTRYTKFFIELLELTNDKTNFELLAKRVRRRTADYFEHQKLWQESCARFLRLLRRSGHVLEGQEDSTFKSLNSEDFNTVALRLESWAQNPNTSHPALDVLRDAIELKRLNNSLMKSATIDDLIGDAYGLLYTSIGSGLAPLPSEQPPSRPPIPVAAPPPSAGAMSISSLMHGDHNAGAQFSFHANQMHPQHGTQLQPPAQPEPPKPKTKAIGRREIARRAEALAQKPAPTTSMPIRSPPVANATLAPLHGRNISPEKSAQPSMGNGLEKPSFDRSGTATAAASVNNDEPERSAPGSVHDDADDESELSELDEEEVQEIEQEVALAPRRSSSITTIKPIFPNLMADRVIADKPVATVDGITTKSNTVSSRIDAGEGSKEVAASEGHEQGGADPMDVDTK